MGSVRDLWRRGYQRLGPRRAWLAPVLLGEAAVLVLVAVLGIVLQVVTTPHPDRVSTRVQACDLATKGAAQVTFTLNNGDRARHSYKVTLIVTGAASKQLGAGAILGVALQVITTPHPDRVSTRVQACDLATKGAAQVAFSLNNGDRYAHSYKVTLVVTGAGSKQLGAGAILVNDVEPGATVTSRMLVPLAGDPTGASCVLRADLFTGTSMQHN